MAALRLVLILLGLLGAINALALTPAEEAAQAYDQGQYAKAAEVYQKLGAAGSGEAYYDLGNALFRAGDLGGATAAYLAARRLLPRDADLAANLGLVHSRASDQLALDNRTGVAGVLARFTAKECAYAAALAFALACLVAALGRFHAKNFLAWGLGLVAIGFTVAFGELARQPPWGAVRAAETAVYAGPGEKNLVLFTLHAGAPFAWLGQTAGWWKIELADGRKGWLPSSSASVFPPPTP